MKAARIKNKVKGKKEQPIKEEYSIKNMIVITVILFAIFGIFYFITTLVAKPEEIKYDNETNSNTQIDLNKITISQLFDRKEKEYYVLAVMQSLYKNSASTATDYINLYKSYINDYKSKENSLQIYTIDLDDAFNKKFIGEKQNITEDLDKIVLNDEVLFKIKNGKIQEYFVGRKDILNKLQKIKEK